MEVRSGPSRPVPQSPSNAPEMPASKPRPKRRIWLAGRLISWLISTAPWSWPLWRSGVERFFDRAARDWDSRTESGSPTHLEPLATAVLRVDVDPERVLEIGCGTGEGSLFLAREFARASVRGVDISSEMIRRATRKVGLDPDARVAFRVGDAAQLPWGHGSFDLVAQINMPVFFSEISRILRPNGTVVITSSFGEDTPFFTSERVLARRFRRFDIEPLESGRAGCGTWFVGRKRQVPDDD